MATKSANKDKDSNKKTVNCLKKIGNDLIKKRRKVSPELYCFDCSQKKKIDKKNKG